MTKYGKAPDKIFLQFQCNGDFDYLPASEGPFDYGVVDWLSEITWCRDRLDSTDISYIREDLVGKAGE